MKRSLAVRAWLACGVAAVCLAGAGIPAGAVEIDDSDPRWNMWVPELKDVTVLSDAWVFENDCHREMKDPGEDEALRSALDYMADRHPDLFRRAQLAVHPLFAALTKSQQKRYCDAAWRKLNGIASQSR
jgi:hypothetical protein